jgi:cobalt-zinc-cadmium resistance protein CzcA
MIESIVSWCLERRWLVVVIFALVAATGIYSFFQLAIEAYPDIADTTAQVVTQYPGHAAEEMEQQVTMPLERELAGTPGLQVMRSRTTFALSLITLVFRDGIDDYWARQRINERIANVTLPPGANPGLDPITSPIGEIYRYTLQSTQRGPRELKDLQDWVVYPQLKQIPGVADVTLFGGETVSFQLVVDPAKLTQYGLALRDVETAITNNNANAGGSVLVTGEQGVVVRGIGLITSLDDLGNVVVTQKNGVPIFLKDVGIVHLGVLQREGMVGMDSASDVVTGIVLLLRGVNPSPVLEAIHTRVADLNNHVLPTDVKVVPYIDRTRLINTTTHTISRTLLEGLILVTIVVLLFIGSVRGALLIALTIPLSLLFAFMCMHFTNIPANLLSLGAIDFGIIVDGSVVMVETILRRHEAHPESEMSENEAETAALHVARPIFFATLIIIVSYLPLFAFQRVERKLFTPMAFTVGYALVGALLTAMLLMPGLAYMLYRKPGKVYRNVLLERVTQSYHELLEIVVLRPRTAIIPGAAAAVLAIILGAALGRDFLPYLDEGSIWLQVQMPPGISIAKGSEMATHLRDVVRTFPEVSYIVTQLGRNEDGTDPWTPSHIEASVGLKPYDEWGGDKQALIRRMDARFSKMPGYQIGFSQPMIDGVEDMIAGAHSELVIRVFGEDFAETRRIATEVRDVLATIPGAADPAIDQEPPLPQLQIVVDRAAAARYGINVSDIADLIQTAIGGQALSQVFLGARRYDVTVRFADYSRNSPSAIGDLQLVSASGVRIPLSQVATIRDDAGESTITHEMGRRHLTVKLDLRGRDLSTFIADARQQIERRVAYDHERFSIAWGGEFENQQRAQARLAVIVPAAMALIFVLLYGQFGDVAQAGIILLNVPLALLGGVLALHLRGMTLNVSSAVGFIALFGVAVQNGVIMVANLNRWRTIAGVPLTDAVIEGAEERLRPVLMTASVATLGLMPAALARGVGSDVQRPLATVIVGGLITATLLTLIVLPALYVALETYRSKREAREETIET